MTFPRHFFVLTRCFTDGAHFAETLPAVDFAIDFTGAAIDFAADFFKLAFLLVVGRFPSEVFDVITFATRATAFRSGFLRNRPQILDGRHDRSLANRGCVSNHRAGHPPPPQLQPDPQRDLPALRP
jgi:hypothetical protein